MNTPSLVVPVGRRLLTLHLPETTVETPDDSVPATCSVEELLMQSLEFPIDYPPLSSALLEDDQVAIAVEASLPDANPIVLALARYLVAHGVLAEKLTVVIGDRNEVWRNELSQQLANQGLDVRVVMHDPHHPESLGYIAASQSADPIYIQRDITEADVVIPIYCLRNPESPIACDKYGISPGFADAHSQHRWCRAWLDDNQHRLHLEQSLSHEAGWLLGIQFAIAVIPTRSGGVASILAGKPDTIFAQATARMEANHSEHAQAESRAGFEYVIAMLEGDLRQQNWMNAARAIANAELRLASTGSIILCTDLDRVTPGIKQLASDDPDDELQRRLSKSDLEDAFAAAVIRSVQARRSIYVMSNLSRSTVERMGFAFVENTVDLERLCHNARSVCLLRGAQF